MHGLDPAAGIFAFYALGLQKSGALSTAVSRSATEVQGLRETSEFGNTIGNFLNGNVNTSLYVARGKFVGHANIYNGHRSV
jgi:hypothetical protein